MTHTFTKLAVPPTVYAAIRALLAAAGYGHAFQHDPFNDAEMIDMHGIAIQSRGGAPIGDVTVTSLLSRSTKEGRVELSVNGDVIQMDLDKAREIVGMLQGAIEAAVSDQLLYQFLTKESIGLSNEQASAAMVEFREMRQGSRDVVRPH